MSNARQHVVVGDVSLVDKSVYSKWKSCGDCLLSRLIWMDVQRKPECALIYYYQNAAQNRILKLENRLVNVAKFKCSIWE